MLSWYLQPEVRSEFDHIWNAPFRLCLPFLPPLSMKIIGYKTSVKSHSSPSSTPSWPHRSNSHNKTPLNLINGALNVVDRGRRFSDSSCNSCGCSTHWPQPQLDSQFLYVSFRCVESKLSKTSQSVLLYIYNNISKIPTSHHVGSSKGNTLHVAIILIATL